MRAGAHPPDNAIQDLEQAIKLNPNYAAAYNNRGLIYAARNDYARAIADYDQAIKIDPKDASAFSNRGNAKLKMGDAAGAEADIQSAKAIGAVRP